MTHERELLEKLNLRIESSPALDVDDLMILIHESGLVNSPDKEDHVYELLGHYEEYGDLHYILAELSKLFNYGETRNSK